MLMFYLRLSGVKVPGVTAEVALQHISVSDIRGIYTTSAAVSVRDG